MTDVAVRPYRPADLEAIKRLTVESSTVNRLGTKATVHVPKALAHRIQQAGGLQRRIAGFWGQFTTECLPRIFNK